MSEVLDIIDRPIKVDDFIVFYSNIYKVISLGKGRADGGASVRIKLVGPKSPKSVVKHSRDMCLIPEHDVTMWLLKKGYR